jgi:hypothetical protein
MSVQSSLEQIDEIDAMLEHSGTQRMLSVCLSYA